MKTSMHHKDLKQCDVFEYLQVAWYSCRGNCVKLSRQICVRCHRSWIYSLLHLLWHCWPQATRIYAQVKKAELKSNTWLVSVWGSITKSIQEPIVTNIFKVMKERQQNRFRYKTLKRRDWMQWATGIFYKELIIIGITGKNWLRSIN